MASPVDERVRAQRRPHGTPATALFWRLFGFNAAILLVAALVLGLSPATVSFPVSATELGVLIGGSALMLAVNAFLLRSTLRPLDGLTALMERVDLLRPGERLSVPADRDVAHLIRTFNDMLDRLEHERGVSSAHALAAQEGERQRIARELHDEIGQSLTAVLLTMKRTVDRAPADLVDELRLSQEMVRSSLDEVRMVARRLRPGVLEDLGLLSALNALATEFRAVNAAVLTIELDPVPAELSADAELVLYRIAQEALTNVSRHSGASRVELTLSAVAGTVVLHVVDDGVGIGAAEEGSGIRGMRERAILVSAELSVTAAPTGGTELRLAVPA